VKPIKDTALLARVRQEPCCWPWCGRPGPSEAAHVFTKGMGGWSRYDIAVNVVPLCRACHLRHHNGGVPTKYDLLVMAAHREGTTVQRIKDVIYKLQCADKEADPAPILAGLYPSDRAVRKRLGLFVPRPPAKREGGGPDVRRGEDPRADGDPGAGLPAEEK
jgi:hypothetical protein